MQHISSARRTMQFHGSVNGYTIYTGIIFFLRFRCEFVTVKLYSIHTTEINTVLHNIIIFDYRNKIKNNYILINYNINTYVNSRSNGKFDRV